MRYRVYGSVRWKGEVEADSLSKAHELADQIPKEIVDECIEVEPDAEAKTMEQQVRLLADVLAEKRSDISAILEAIADGNFEEEDLDTVESRYVTATLPDGSMVRYDTLTTLIYLTTEEGHFAPLDTEYEDD